MRLVPGGALGSHTALTDKAHLVQAPDKSLTSHYERQLRAHVRQSTGLDIESAMGQVAPICNTDRGS